MDLVSPTNSLRPPSLARTLLVLGRTSNLPTVWSNVFTAILLSSGLTLPVSQWIFLLVGSTVLYVGGMFLNDAFDAEFDKTHRIARPIALGHISQSLVFVIGWSLLFGGAIVWKFGGRVPWPWSASVVLAIIAYDRWHKKISWAPWIMASCRFFLFAGAAASGSNELSAIAWWSAIVLSAWVVGLCYVARTESFTKFKTPPWPLALLASPLLLAFLVNDVPFRSASIFWSIALLLWTWRSLRFLWQTPPRIGACVSSLLAGICLVDLLAVAPQFTGDRNQWIILAVLVACFGLARLAQRWIPAT